MTKTSEIVENAASALDPALLKAEILRWAQELGFAGAGVSGVDLGDAEHKLAAWLAEGFHGEMDYMARHGSKRARPAELVPGTVSVISVRMDYWSEADRAKAEALLGDAAQAYISRYALGRDYHKVLRNRLQQLADRLAERVGSFGHRVFVDSAPVLEVELASRAGLGWRGKHSLLLTREAGSLFFLGELFVDLALPPDAPVTEHCGDCRRCIDVCPTQAIVAPYKVDARRCISYLTIELRSTIPVELRPLIGNRVYGCDDCQLTCPWNRFAQTSDEPDFAVRNGLDGASLVELFGWSREDFERRLEGSAIRRIGYECWLRNLAVGLGNYLARVDADSPGMLSALSALRARQDDPSELVREHVVWALAQHAGNTAGR